MQYRSFFPPMLLFIAALFLSIACDDDHDGNGAGSHTVANTIPAADTTSAVDTNADTTVEDKPLLPVYFGGAQKIFEEKCAGCHTGDTQGACLGGTCLGSFYSDVTKDANTCTEKSVGACALKRIQNGTMPPNGCTGDPAQDIDNAVCLTQEEQDLLQTWIDAGIPEE